MPVPPRSRSPKMTTPNVSLPGPYRIVDMVSSSNAKTNTSTAPAASAVASGGRTTVRHAVADPAPLARAARTRSGESRSSAACAGRCARAQNFARYATRINSADPASQRP